MNAEENISIRQDEESFLKMRVAARNIYSKAKCAELLRFGLCVVLVIILFFLKTYIFNIEFFSQLVSYYGLIASVANLCLLNLSQSYRAEAASVQQLHDSELFNISWDNLLWGPKPDLNLINEMQKNKNADDVRGWYYLGGVECSSLEWLIQVLICMRVNVSYDKDMHTKFKKVLIVITLIVSLLFVIFCWHSELWSIFTFGIIPLMPFCIWIYRTIVQLNNDVKNLDNLNEKVQTIWDNALNNHIVDNANLCKLQYLIYLHRKANYPIYDFFYKKRRDNSEDNMRFAVDEYIKEYKQKRQYGNS